MKIKQLKLFTNNLEKEIEFYSEKLQFEIVRNKNSFSVKVGWTKLIFEESAKEYNYHYCFLVPSNQLNGALKWLENKTEIIKIEEERRIQNFDSWNADSFYFLDGSKNIVEFIVHYDLDYKVNEFNQSKILGVCEIGLPTKNIKEINNQLKKELKTELWKGDLIRFGTNGSTEGKFLLPNYEIKETWFPTGIKIEPNPFKAIIENLEKEYLIEYSKEKLRTKPIK